MEEFGHFGSASNVDIVRYVYFSVFQGFLPPGDWIRGWYSGWYMVYMVYGFFLQLMKPFSNTGFVIVNLLQTAKLGSTSVSPPCKQLFDKKLLTHCLLDVVSVRF